MDDEVTDGEPFLGRRPKVAYRSVSGRLGGVARMADICFPALMNDLKAEKKKLKRFKQFINASNRAESKNSATWFASSEIYLPHD